MADLGLTDKVLFRSLKSTFSRYDNVRASSTLFILLNENALFEEREKNNCPSGLAL